jgi:hypothetical protein
MEQSTVKKSLVGILILKLLFSINVTLAQTRSMPVEQNINSTQIVPGAPIKYQHFGKVRRISRLPTGVREHCLLDADKSFTVLVPENNPVLTTVERPQLFFYIPKTSKTSVKGFEFVLQNANKQVIYQKKYKVHQKPGIFSLDLPADKNQPLLEVEREYNWYLVIICERTDPSYDLVVAGTVRRILPDQNLTSKLKKASPRERAALYAANGIWYNSLAILAQLRRQRPTDAALKTDWQNLLGSVNLGNISQEALLGELEVERN